MFKSYLEAVSNDIEIASSSYLFWKTIQNMPSDDKELLKALNRTPMSWILIRQSLMLNLIMALGRIFDGDQNALSADKLFKHCIDNIDTFSKESLKKRKLSVWSDREDFTLEDYIDEKTEPEVSDFQMLRGGIRSHTNTFNEFYKPIRHKIFAHRDIDSLDKTDEIWSATKSNNIEDTLYFLNDLINTLKGTYDNGNKLKLGNYKWDTEFYKKDFVHLMSIVKAP